MKKPIVGVMPLYDSSRNSLWMLPGYMDCLTAAGVIPVMLPLCHEEKTAAQMIEMLDGLLFTGGHDISPELYGEEKSTLCGEVCAARDRMEEEYFRRALEKNMPIFGICRGIQLINALCGGSLWQDLPSAGYENICHKQSPPYDEPIHRVEILEDTPLRSLLGKTEIFVNSYHHQAIKTLADSLKPMAVSEDGIIEAVYMPDKDFVWAVQWHPEFCYLKSPENARIVERFAEECKIRRHHLP